MSKPLHFEKGMEINGISPLPQYYEEIYANLVGIRELGLRGDDNYLFYSVGGRGSGYYEEAEKALSADSAYEYFKDPAHRKRFFDQLYGAVKTLSGWTDKIEATNLFDLSVKQLAEYFLKVNQLHGMIFSHYIVSQPYRIVRFEEQLRGHLVKRVATSRIDHYATILATSNKPTIISREELAWLHLMIQVKRELEGTKLDTAHLEAAHPHIHKLLVKHFDDFKTLTLGDGNWKFDIGHFVAKLKRDYKTPIVNLEAEYEAAKKRPAVTEAARQQLIEDLYLDDETKRLLDFLAEIGHSRLVARTEGWVPFVRTIIKVDIALTEALKLSHETSNLLNYMSEDEIKYLASTGTMISEAELLARAGERSEFLLVNDHGVAKLYFGEEAGRKFRKLVPPVNHASFTEVRGTTAVLGKITGKVCVYRWGDNMAAKTNEIRRHPILVAGQTRPAMMAMIRLAKGIVTEEGGITSHAAIISRELGIPSVIGTVYATSVFQSGDLVELDANNGVVRKLS